MTERLTKERIEELLDEIRDYEDMLRPHEDDPKTTLAWTTLAIAKAKLTALKGESK